MSKFCGLIILDGFGYSTSKDDNAIAIAGVPNIRKISKENSSTLIGASGFDVGLPDGQMGNSEVGHLNIGAGRIVYQELTRISKSIKDGDFYSNDALNGAIQNAVTKNKKLHLMGLMSDGGVHSHIEHLFALIELAKAKGVKNCIIHCFMDGRDVPPESGKAYIEQLQAYIKKIGYGKIASICGRFFAMDRDNRWDRVERAYDMMTMGIGNYNPNPVKAMELSYANGITDEFVEPIVITRCSKPIGKFAKGDSMIFFNFRPDRAREITRAFIEENFDGFDRKSGYITPYFVSLTSYKSSFTNIDVAYKPTSITNTLGEYIASKGLKQVRIAETEKYAHVTFFFNGGSETPNEGEDRILVPSPKVLTYDLKPEMSAYEVTDKAVEAIKSGKYNMMILNLANCDMVGHTGIMAAAVKACEVVDICTKRIVDAIKSIGGIALITADHGNAEKMLEDDGVSVFTAHSTNPVPFVIVDDVQYELRNDGVLADIAPTMLQLMGIQKPAEMTGVSIIK